MARPKNNKKPQAKRALQKPPNTEVESVVKTATTPKIIERYVSPSISGTILKRGTQAGVIESATELAQDEISMIAAGAAANPEAKTYGEILKKLPYTEEQIKNRRYNNAFLGALGGKLFITLLVASTINSSILFTILSSAYCADICSKVLKTAD